MTENLEFLPRGNQKELLELAKLIFGGTLQRKKGTLTVYTIQRPGAYSHARWMSKAIHTQKLTLLKHQFPGLTWHKKQKLNKMSFLILFVFVESWFRSSSLFTVASDGLIKRHQRLLKLRNINGKLAHEGLTSTSFLVPYPGDGFGVSILQKHIWIHQEQICWDDINSPGW